MNHWSVPPGVLEVNNPMRTPNVAKMDGNQQLALYICSAVCAEKAKKEKNSAEFG